MLYKKLKTWDDRAGTRFVRIAIGLLVAAFMLGGYYGFGYWNAARFGSGLVEPVSLAIAIDGVIPALPWTVWPYLLYIPTIISPGFLHWDFDDFISGCLAYVLASAIAFFFFIVWPVRMEYPPLDCVGLSCNMLKNLHAMDGGLNVFPSLHLSHCTLAVLCYWRAQARALPLVALMAGMVCMATLFTRQHYIVDLPAGLANAALAWWLSLRLQRRWAAA